MGSRDRLERAGRNFGSGWGGGGGRGEECFIFCRCFAYMVRHLLKTLNSISLYVNVDLD